jgi:hypothetical protein
MAGNGESKSYVATDNELIIGVTGHRILMDLDRLRHGINYALDLVLRAYPARSITMYSALAEGADRLVAEEFLLRATGRLIAILPLSRADYMMDFRDAASNAEFDRLIAQANDVVTLSRTATREQAYENVGHDIIRAGNRDPATAEATTLGDEQGHVILEYLILGD